jgi:hypothetical protein
MLTAPAPSERRIARAAEAIRVAVPSVTIYTVQTKIYGV